MKVRTVRQRENILYAFVGIFVCLGILTGMAIMYVLLRADAAGWRKLIIAALLTVIVQCVQALVTSVLVYRLKWAVMSEEHDRLAARTGQGVATGYP